jgi:urease accessory protein
MSAQSDVAGLLRLMAWMSPAFPVGAFSYSAGLEGAVHDGLLSNPHELSVWVKLSLERGALWNDAVLLAAASRCHEDDQALHELCELARALAGSAERYRETVQLGDAFVVAAKAWPHQVFELLPPQTAYPVAVGAVAGAHGVDPVSVIAAYLHAGVSQIVSAAIRLGLAGQTDGVAILANTEQLLTDISVKAKGSTLDDLGSSTILADIAFMRHEIQHSRLFRS